MTTHRRETRSVALAQLELRAAPEGSDSPGVLEGYAATFGRQSKPIGGSFVEVVEAGAFSASLSEGADVRCCRDHQAHLLLGRMTAGDLQVSEDHHGLRFSVTLPDTQAGLDTAKDVRSGRLRECSFTFKVREGGQRWEAGAGPGGLDVRYLTAVDLVEVAPCAFPIYEGTELACRSHEAWRGSNPREDTVTKPENRQQQLPTLSLRGGLVPAWDAEAEAAWSRRHPGEQRACFASYLGGYLMLPRALRELVARKQAGSLEAMAAVDPELDDEDRPYERANGCAIIKLSGPLKKHTKYHGTSTVHVRRALRQAVADVAVSSIMLLVDESPGGHVAGTAELAEEVRKADKAKPVHAHIQDLGASAAYWVACQARRVTANATAEVGSIGVVAVLEDSSGWFDAQGIKVHVVATGAHKGAGTPGTELLPEHLAHLQSVVDGLAAFFHRDVAKARNLTGERLQAVLDGRTWLAEDAVGLGLLDAVASLEDALGAAQAAGSVTGGEDATVPTAPSSAAVELAEARQRQARAEGGEDDDPEAEDGREDEDAMDDGEDLEDAEDQEHEDAEDQDDDPDAEGDEDDPEAEDDDERPEPGAVALAYARQRQARATLSRAAEDDLEDDPEAEDDDDDPAAEGDEDPEAMEDEDDPEAMEDEDDPEAMDEDEDPEAFMDDEDPDAEGDEDELEAEDDDDEPAGEGDDDDPEAEDDDGDPDANVDPSLDEHDLGAPEDPGDDPDTSNPGDGDEQQDPPGAEDEDEGDPVAGGLYNGDLDDLLR